MAFPTSPSNGDEYTNALGTIYKYLTTDDKWYIISAPINLNDLTEKDHVSLDAKNGEADVQHLTAAQVAALHAATYYATGQFTGNTANNRQITGLGFTPTFMIMVPYVNVGATWMFVKNTNHAMWEITFTHTAAGDTNILKFIAGGFEVNNNHASDQGNVNNRTYYWAAWG